MGELVFTDRMFMSKKYGIYCKLYVICRVGWRHINKDGEETILTEGFYIVESAKPLFDAAGARYAFDHREKDSGYAFIVDMTGSKPKLQRCIIVYRGLVANVF